MLINIHFLTQNYFVADTVILKEIQFNLEESLLQNYVLIL